MPDVGGHCEPQFHRVRRAFAQNFDRFGELGAAVAVFVDGRRVVDLWGGHRDAARSFEWERDTIVGVASTTKGLTALCAHMLVERGFLDLDAPVATYWPEFARHGKHGVLVRHVLSHQAGLVKTDGPLTSADYLDRGKLAHAIEETKPSWTPGSAYAYHPVTFGIIVGELVRRASGCTVGNFLRVEVTEPLDIEFYIGFGPELDCRVAEFVVELPLVDLTNGRLGVLSPGSEVLLGCTRASRAVEQPSGNGHGTARALATVYGALAAGGSIDGVRLLRPETVASAAVEQVATPWREAAESSTKIHWTLGWMSNATMHMGPNPRSFGNMGGGGSMAFADPDAHIGFGHVMNRFRPPSRFDPRRTSLIEAVYASM